MAALTAIVGMKASIPAGVWLITTGADHVRPPSLDCENRIRPILGAAGTASSQAA